MLLTEWDTEEAKVVWFEEGREEGLAEGREEGLAEGREEGREEGLAEGREERDAEIARNALAEGFTVETVQKITGLEIKDIENIQAGM